MDNIPFNLKSYRNRLSPFGQKVFHVLLEEWKSEQVRNNRRIAHSACAYAGEYADSSYRNSNKRRAPRDNSEKRNNFGSKKCHLKFIEKETQKLPTPPDLLNSKIAPIQNVQDVIRSDDLVMQVMRISEPPRSSLDERKDTDAIHFEYFNTAQKIRSNVLTLDLEPSLDPLYVNEEIDVTWNNMFDTELFENINDNCDNNTREIAVDNQLTVNPKEISEVTFIKPSYSKRKCLINTANTVDQLSKVDKQNIYRKEKITKTVKNWLNDVEQQLADVNNNEKEEPYLQGETKNVRKDSYKKKTSKKAINAQLKQDCKNNTREKDCANLKIDTSKNKSQKKVIQAQLKNKDGKMKFGKPKIAVDSEKKEVTLMDPIESNCMQDKEVVKEKKINTKFVAPIKSQVPVKDISYNITTFDLNAVKDQDVPFNGLESAEIFMVLVYSNGFCQLNGCYTEDTCIPEGFIMYISNDDGFYYFTNINENLRTVLTELLQKNTIVCYEGKSILIFLSHLNLNFMVHSIWDAKIGGALLDPENPPETFTDLQKLVGFTPEFTIATDCRKQKAAWYTTLLRDCAAKLKILLIENSLWSVFVDLEMRLLPIIADMESRGVTVDLDKLKDMEHLLMTKLKAVEQESYKAAGKKFQINSTLQVRALLFDELKLDAKCNVKIRETLIKGAKSTSEATLRSLMSVHPLPKLILEYRHLHKAHATFLSGIAQHVRDGIVRPTWVQTAAATGRIASNNPNLQAIPKAPFSLVMFPESDEADTPLLNFRSVYIPRAEYSMLAADFKHVECRVFAHAAADTALLAALNSDDLFRVLAAQWLNKSEEEVCSADRERTKRIVYASLYGCGARKLMDILQLSYEQALSILSSFNRTFLSLKSFGRSVVKQCSLAGGRLTTLSGRARTFRNISSDDFAAKSHAERQAVNFIVQGSAADLCKSAMVQTQRRLRGRTPALRAHLLLQIHDELVWEVHNDDLDQVAGVVKEVMEGCGGSLRLPVALAAGPSWGELTPLENTRAV